MPGGTIPTLRPQATQPQPSEEGRSLWQTFLHLGGSGLQIVTGAPGVKQVLAADRHLYSNYVSHPISTALLAANPAYDNQRGALENLVGGIVPGSFTTQQRADQAWQDASTVSPGQAYQSLPVVGWKPMLNAFNGDEDVRATYFSGLDPTSPQQQDWANRGVGRVVTGGADGVLSWYADPLVVGGKVVGAARQAGSVREIGPNLGRATAIKQANAEIAAHTAATPTGLGTKLEFAAKSNDLNAIRNLDFVKNSSRPDLLAGLLKDADTYDKAALVVRAALGDADALSSLGKIDAHLEQAITFQAEWRRGATIDPNGVVHPPWETLSASEKAGHTALLDAWQVERDDLTRHLGSYALGGESRSGGIANTVDRLGGRTARTASRQIGAAERASRRQLQQTWLDSAQAAARNSKLVEVLQKNPYSRPVVTFQWPRLRGEAPSGMVITDGDLAHRGSEEILAFLNSVRQMRGPEFAEYKAGVLDNWARLTTSRARLEYMSKVEEDVAVRIAESHGTSVELARDLYSSYARARQSAIEFATTNGYLYQDGGLIHSPQLVTQLANHVPIMDARLMDRLLSREAGEGLWANWIGQGAAARAGAWKDSGVAAASWVMNNFWKPSVLFRLGYPIRNAMDNSIRTWAYGGSAFEALPQGMKNFLYRSSSFVNGRVLKAVDNGIAQHQLRLAQIDREMAPHAEALRDVNVTGAARKEAQTRLMAGQVEANGIKSSIDELGSLRTQLEARAKVLRVGESSFSVTYKGQTVLVDGAYANERGEIARLLSGADESTERVMNSPGRATQVDELSRNWKTVRPDEGEVYWTNLADVLNKQFKFDPLVARYLKGASWYEMRKWMVSNSGRTYRRELGIDWGEHLPPDLIDDHILTVVEATERYLPDAGLRAILGERAVSSSELRAALGSRADLSPIHGRGLANLTGRDSLKGMWENAVRKTYNALGTAPENVLSRHPFYSQVYRKEMEQLIRSEIDQVGEVRSLDALADAAHAKALRATQDTLFTIHRYSNVAATMRFLSPFFAAWENTMRTYARLGLRTPSKIGQAALVWNAPNRMGLVYDSDGNQIKEATGITDDAYITFQLPWGDKSLGGLTQIALPKAGFNVALQGDPWWAPGFGPVVQVPVSEIVKDHPTLEGTVSKFVLPYGPNRDALDAFLPAWAKRARALTQQDKSDFANATANIYASERLKYVNGERDKPPTLDEARARAKALYETRILANLTLPVSPQFQSPYKFYVDEYRRMQTQYGRDAAQQKFYDQYGDEAFKFATTTLSKNVTGVDYSVESVRRQQKFNSLAQNLSDIDPELVSLVTNTAQRGEFSDAAYAYYYDRPVRPGSSLEYRSNYDPGEASKAAEIRLGWLKYTQGKAELTAMLAQRGLTMSDLSSNAAADLNAAWQDYKRNVIGTTTDPVTGQTRTSEWWFAYNQRDDGGWAKNIKGLQMAAGNAAFMNYEAKDPVEGPGWQLVQTYLNGRKEAMAMLQQRAAAGGSGSITAKANADIARAWDAWTQKLRGQNTYFASLYDRFIEGDQLQEIPGDDAN